MFKRSLAAALLSLACANAATIRSFIATAGAPNTQGWGSESGILSGANVTDLGQSAWQMTGNNCCGYWFNNLTTTEWADAFTRGWSLRGAVRTTGTASVGYIFLDVPVSTGRNRFDISFGNDGTNGWAGLSAFTDFANPALKATFSGNGYHLLDMRWDATTQSASLWVDGVLTLSGYTGHTQFRESHGPAFGVAGLTTQGFFQSVAFSINDPAASSTVPEPGTFVLAAAGLLLAVRRKLSVKVIAPLALAALALPAATIGESLIDRPFVDTVTGAGFLYQGALPVGERVASYQFFNNNTANANWITPLLFDTLPGGLYQIVGIGLSRQNTGAGIQGHAFGLQTGSDLIAEADYVFGWWNGRISGGSFFGNTGVIDFSAAASNPGFRESCPAPNVGPCGISPVVGQNVAFNNIYAGASSGSLGAPNGRVYSVELTTAPNAVPEPATSALLLVGFVLLGYKARNRGAK